MALCPEHPKRDQNPKFTPLSETTSIPVCFIWESPPQGVYMLEIKKHVRWITTLSKRHRSLKCSIGISSIFKLVFRYLPLFRMVLRYWAPSNVPLNELPKVRFEFPLILIGKFTMALLTVQSWYTGDNP